MAIVEWDESLESGCSILDKQHKKLFQVLNYIHESLNSAHTEEVLARAIVDLTDYAHVHLRTEEGLMAKYNVSGLAAHMAEHDRFRDYVRQLTGDTANTTKDQLSQMMLYLMKWLVKHIRKTDMRYKGLIPEE